jgi:hypothetical protein
VCYHNPNVFPKLAKYVRSYINYTTKIVPERYLLDNEGKDDFGGMAKVCEIAHFLCGIAHSAQGEMLKNVWSGLEIYKNQ